MVVTAELLKNLSLGWYVCNNYNVVVWRTKGGWDCMVNGTFHLASTPEQAAHRVNQMIVVNSEAPTAR